jgi:hypothetical protein
LKLNLLNQPIITLRLIRNRNRQMVNQKPVLKLHTTLGAYICPEVGCSLKVTHRIMAPDGKSRPREPLTMVHDLVLALAFLALIIAPALLAMRSDKGEKDVL